MELIRHVIFEVKVFVALNFQREMPSRYLPGSSNGSWTICGRAWVTACRRGPHTRDSPWVIVFLVDFERVGHNMSEMMLRAARVDNGSSSLSSLHRRAVMAPDQIKVDG
jgi:hypothetical protein